MKGCMGGEGADSNWIIYPNDFSKNTKTQQEEAIERKRKTYIQCGEGERKIDKKQV